MRQEKVLLGPLSSAYRLNIMTPLFKFGIALVFLLSFGLPLWRSELTR